MSRRNRNHRSTSSDESFSPVAKRTRAAKENQKETLHFVQAKEKYEPTILDILIEDCWRYVFDYVSVRDIVRSERVSRQWQRNVHNYIRGARLCVQDRNHMVPSVCWRGVNVIPVHYIKFIEKFGPAIVASYCLSEIDLRTLGKNSPNLEELSLCDGKYHNLKNQPVHFNRLRKLHITHKKFEDSDITKLLYPTLEELKISDYGYNMITGVCLNDLKSNLKSLHLERCRWLNINHMLAASHRLADITKLVLKGTTRHVLNNVSKILPKTPKLEYLVLEECDFANVVGLVEAICDLKRLKHLSFNGTSCVVDEGLQALGQRCQLQSLDIGYCRSISPAGVEAFCRGASRTLTELGLSHSEVTDEDVVRCITLCPDLELLDLQRCSVSRSLPARVAALGRRAITLRLWKLTFRGNPITETYSNVVLDWRGIKYLLHGCDDDF